MVYTRDQMNLTPSLSNITIQRTSPRTASLEPLHKILPGHGLDLCYAIYMSTSTVLEIFLCHSCCEYSTAATKSVRFLLLLPSLEFSIPWLPTLPSWIDSLFHTGFNSPCPTLFNSRFLIRFDLRFLIHFDSIFFYSIWITFNTFIFDLCQIIRVTFYSGLRESHIGQGVFKKSALKSWNIPQLRELRLALTRKL